MSLQAVVHGNLMPVCVAASRTGKDSVIATAHIVETTPSANGLSANPKTGMFGLGLGGPATAPFETAVSNPNPAELELISLAASLTGFDFTETGPRSAYTNSFLATAEGGTLVTGATRGSGASAHVINIGSTASVTLSNWDLTGANMVVDQGATVVCNDCKIAPSTGICVDVFQDNSTFTANYCDIDGLQLTDAGQGTLIRLRSGYTGASCTLNYSKVHGIGNDATNGAMTLSHCWFYDAGYGSGAHSDYVQIISGNGMSADTCLFDGTADGQPVEVNNALRLVAEAGGSIDTVTITNSVIVNASSVQPPIALGNRTDSPAGVAAAGFDIHDNWIRKNASNPSYIYASYGPSGGTNRWYRNYDLDSLSAIGAPALGTWLSSS